VFLCRKTEWFRVSYFFGQFDKKIALNLSKFAAMALTTAACLPVAQILIRNHLISDFGVEYAGYWEAMWRLSSAYLLLVTTTLGVYYLPRLSELVGYDAVVKEVAEGYKFILPVALVCCLTVYFLRDFVIHVLFSEQFLPMRDLFAFQLIGDVMKIGSWILAYVMLGQAMYKLYIVTEIIFAFTLYFCVLLFTRWHGFEGVVEGYALNYLLYWIVMFACITVALKKKAAEASESRDTRK
jgi:PST family polysaccharide transporter